jgi:UDP:flavonoid glycosyltransferase YjiC (YdhE family)
MRIICTCIPAKGHFYPMVPLARAIVDAGHELVFATSDEFQNEVTKAGFDLVPAGFSLPALQAALLDRKGFEGLAADEQAALMFGRIAPTAMRDSLLPFAKQWSAQLIIHEETEYAGPLVSSMLKIPNAVVGWPAPMRSPAVLQRLHLTLGELWRESGQSPVEIGGIYRYLFLDTCPPSLQASHAADYGHRQHLRPIIYDTPLERPTGSWLSALGSQPTVHVTMGTVPIYNSASLIFQTIIDGLSTERVNVVVTVGESNDPASMIQKRDFVHVERYIPHSHLLPHCNLVICHGGCGSTVSSLIHGLPLLILPRGGAVQRRNALACAAYGAARVLYNDEITADEIRKHVRDLLYESRCKLAAERISQEIRTMPDPSLVVEVLEELVRRS